MTETLVNEIDPAVVAELRSAFTEGALGRQLVAIAQGRLGVPRDAVVPILASFTQAFKVPLIRLIPLRELLAEGKEQELDDFCAAVLRPH